MTGKKKSVMGKGRAIFGFFFAMIMALGGIFNIYMAQAEVYAEPETTEVTETTETDEANAEHTDEEHAEETGDAADSETVEQAEEQTTEQNDSAVNSTVDQCQNSLGQIGWLVCPTTGKIAEAVDWLYGKIADILTVDPVEAKDGTPIYEIWKYCRGITNIIFIIFLLVVIYSQLTGLGISNYGIKKVLPKLIVVAVMVNLSFLLCSIAVDVSNIVGSSLRGVFTSVQESAVAGMVADGGLTAAEMKTSQVEMYSALAGGTALTIGGAVVAFETGAIWMLIPVLLGALVSVVTGLVTIAMRQAVIALLIMISPLAVVAYMLPNTENLFKKWKNLFTQMLVFYPMFSLLFGASSLAGFAIIASAKDGFGVLLGVAVQIFPLFFSWKMMKMSGTVLGTINSGMQRLASAPLAKNRAWADSHRQLTKQRYLASDRAVTPSLRLNQYLNNRKIAREAEITDKSAVVKNRGLAYRANRNYRNGIPTRYGESAYRDQALSMEYQRAIERDKNNMNKGLGQLEAVKGASLRQQVRLDALDTRVMNASDYLHVEQARGKVIEYENAVGLHERLNKAINVHMDEKNGYKMHEDEYVLDAHGNRVRNEKYRLHELAGSAEFDAAKARYDEMFRIMEGNTVYAQFAAADASVAYDTQAKILRNTMLKYLELTPPTRDVEFRLSEITMRKDATRYIDAIIPGMQILNQRGDTDLLQIQLDNVLTGGKNSKVLLELSGQIKDIQANTSLSEEEKKKAIEELRKNASLNMDVETNETERVGVQLGSHASQALASFLMFDVKDNDPFLRRFGKYINLETANAFNSNKRQELNVTYDEYIRGYHLEPNGEIMYAKRGMKELMEGTSLDNMERTAMSNLDTRLRMAYEDKDGNLDVDEFFKKREEVETAIAPQLISASLKYLSGSEQLRSIVKFKTGFDYKQKKETYIDENGNEKERVVLDENGDPVYIWEPIWAEGRNDFSDADKEKARKYFEQKTLKYLADQTPSQILGLRSDYRDPLFAHLSHAYEDDNAMKGWSDDDKKKRLDYMAELAEIETRYGDLPLEEANKRRKADKAALRKTHEKEWAGVEFRQLLDASGKYGQILRTRRSGAANNAKDWVRELLELDNEVAITKRLDEKRKEEKKKLEEERRVSGDVSGEREDAGGVYSEADRMVFMTEVDDLWQKLRDEDTDVFFNESLQFVRSTLGKSGYIAKQYERYYENDPLVDNYMLREYLKELLSDPENY